MVLLIRCQEEKIETLPDQQIEEIIHIPVVVHVIYNQEEFNISDEKIASQITVLNQDYRKRNTDQHLAPAEFSGLIADVGIEFELATKDPQGNPTTGITRTQSDITGWDGRNLAGDIPVANLGLYFSEKGGHDAWPRDQYLNIWVAEMSDRTGRLGLAGFAQYPGADARLDGVVIDPRVFGTKEPLEKEHKLGRTATHEIGHWLNLVHIFGTSTDCETTTDFVDDTPKSSTPFLGKPQYPQHSCGNSSMFMNFMDYVDDDAMCMFTKGQKERMRAVFTAGNKRNALYNNIRTR